MKSSSVDAFELTLTGGQKHASLTEMEKAPNAKNIFAQVIQSLKGWAWVGVGWAGLGAALGWAGLTASQPASHPAQPE